MAKRIYSIDAVRIIAMVFIITIHTDLFQGVGTYGNVFNFLIDSTARFAVPFFFMTSGYFFAVKIARRDPTDYFVERVRSISSLYAVGLLLTAPVFLAKTVVQGNSGDQTITSSAVQGALEFTSPLELFYYGTSVSEILWFLPALLISLTFVYGFAIAGKSEYLLPVSFGFHAVGLLGASYTMFVDVPFMVRDPLFFGFFYTSLGFFVYSSEWQPTPERSAYYLGATVLFGVLNLVERYALGYVIQGETFAQGVYTASYTIATVLVAGSLFAFLLSRPNLGASTSLPSWGTYAVGIYITHPAVLFVLEWAHEVLRESGYAINTIAWHLTLTPATFFGSLFVYLAIRRLRTLEIGRDTLPIVRRSGESDSK
ncbi:acyltransferase [Natronorubrum halophilum]|uniref:acyltransferase n=1 Tax=Natronorubrum halophilum TaxID=1702106 RepID=UPI0010C1A955|nr:acyltransferase [Natronorubrum halophilum]